jgi:hypothetical protein
VVLCWQIAWTSVAERLSGDGEPRSASKLHWIDELRVSGSFLDSRDHEMRVLNTVSKSFWVYVRV